MTALSKRHVGRNMKISSATSFEASKWRSPTTSLLSSNSYTPVCPRDGIHISIYKVGDAPRNLDRGMQECCLWKYGLQPLWKIVNKILLQCTCVDLTGCA